MSKIPPEAGERETRGEVDDTSQNLLSFPVVGMPQILIFRLFFLRFVLNWSFDEQDYCQGLQRQND